MTRLCFFGLLFAFTQQLYAQQGSTFTVKVPYEVFEAKVLCSYQNCTKTDGQYECEGSNAHFDDASVKKMTEAKKKGLDIHTSIGKLGLVLNISRLYIAKKCSDKMNFDGNIWWSNEIERKQIFMDKGQTVRIILYKFSLELQEVIDQILQ